MAKGARASSNAASSRFSVLATSGAAKASIKEAMPRDEYLAFHLAVSRFLMDKCGETFDAAMANETAEFDWHNDARGRENLPYEAYFTLVFEIAEMWAGTDGDLDEYVDFLAELGEKLRAGREAARGE